jgi:homogentisate 1,2-dioxygenase
MTKPKVLISKSAAASTSTRRAWWHGNLVSGRMFHDHGHYMGKWMALLDAARAAKTK